MLDSSSSGNKSKKRGRKPKGKIVDYKKMLNSDVESDEDPIITHLPIKLEDLNETRNETTTGCHSLSFLGFSSSSYCT